MTALSCRTVGLFGTCGGSRWRDAFIARYEALGIPYFNPQVDNWTPELADIEAWHLANDSLILFPITNETFAAGSLAETGFSALTAARTNENRFVVLFIDPNVDDTVAAQNPQAAKDSVRARKLVAAHLKQNPLPNVFVVESLEEMLEHSVKLFAALELISSIRKPDANWRAKLSPQTWLELVIAAGVTSDAQNDDTKVSEAVA
jgi:hypothetical protein